MMPTSTGEGEQNIITMRRTILQQNTNKILNTLTKSKKVLKGKRKKQRKERRRRRALSLVFYFLVHLNEEAKTSIYIAIKATI